VASFHCGREKIKQQKTKKKIKKKTKKQAQANTRMVFKAGLTKEATRASLLPS